MENTTEEVENNCEAETQILLEWKLIFVGIIGLLTAVISVIHNCLLFWTFSTSRALRSRNLTYLRWISGCDIFISISYVAIMCVQAYTDYFASEMLFVIWHHSLRVAFAVSHVTLSSASFLLMAVTMERFLRCKGGHHHDKQLLRFLTTKKPVVVMVCFAAGILLKGSVYFEIAVVDYPECTGLASMGLATRAIFPYPTLDVIWKFWLRKALTVLLPFVALAYFNARIVMAVRRSDHEQTVKALVLSVTVGQGQRGEQRRKVRARLRAVTRMLVMVVSCYLVSNIIDVLVALWETIDISSLRANAGFYTILSDVSSFLPILSCALRMPIYACNDEQIRKQILQKLNHCVGHAFCCCPTFEEMRIKRKLHQAEHQKLFLSSPRDSINSSNITTQGGKFYGIGSLIIARATYTTEIQTEKDLELIEDTTSVQL